MTHPACSGGSCQQGKYKCETPWACQIPIEEDNALADFIESAKPYVYLAGIAILSICAIAMGLAPYL